MADIATAYAKTLKDYAATRSAFSALTGAPLSSKAFDLMLAAAFNASQEEGVDEKGRAKAIAENRKLAVMKILQSPTCTVKGTAGTMWAGLNAITEYVDHEARTRQTDETVTDAQQRFISANFDGAGSKAKARAFEQALALV